MKRLMLALAIVACWAPVGARALPINVMLATYYQYVPGQADGPIPLEIEQGTSLEFVNLDPFGAHDVIALDLNEEGEPLFYAPPINSNEATEVGGVDALAPGDYGFWCSVHGADLMSGTLTIVPALVAS
jgi:hypothetical protein